MGVASQAGGAAAEQDPARKPAAARATGTSLIRLPVEPEVRAKRHGRASLVLWGTGVAVALGLGTAGVRVARSPGTAVVATAQQAAQADGSVQVLHRLEDEVARLKGSINALRVAADGARQDESLRGLRRSVDGLRQEIDQVKSASGTNLAQLSTRIDKADHDPSPKLAEIAARLDKLDHDASGKGTDAAEKLAEVQSRLERVERQVSSPAPTGSIPPASRPAVAPVPVAAKPAVAKVEPAAPRPAVAVAAPPAVAPVLPKTLVAKVDPPAARPGPVANWVIRDVYDGVALIQGRGGDLREVGPGEYLPGLGEVRSIERRGRAWVVLTSRGAIE